MGRNRRRRGKGRGEYKKKDTLTKNDEKGDSYVQMVTSTGNFKMECYFALQGMHDFRWEKSDESEIGVLVECKTDEEKNAERKEWRTTLADALPASFRFGKDVPSKLLQRLEAELQELLKTCSEESMKMGDQETKEEDEKMTTQSDDDKEEKEAKEENDKSLNNKRVFLPLPDPDKIIHKLKFLPHAYQMDLDRTIIRKHPALQPLHNWLKQQTDAGFIMRQETVSMIPPVVLQVQPTDTVIDMCAAPGSKTSQLLEDLNSDGCLIANDNNPQRAYMLTHQLKRISTINPVVLITAVDAQFFPVVTQFDRALCDVPCSGDGTSRKNIHVWRSWNSVSAYALHALQLNIAWKGASQLVKVGGFMCYSTCSFNPIENEAVVAELLRRSNGALELVDCATTGFRTRPGLKEWKVLLENKTRKEMKNKRNKNNAKMKSKRKEYEAKEGEAANNIEQEEEEEVKSEVKEDNKDDAADGDVVDVENDGEKDEYSCDQEKMFGQIFDPSTFDEETLLKMASSCGLEHYKKLDEVPQRLEKRVRTSCFPPTEEENEKFHLERCLRCLPQDNDTGGFFVALLRKVGPISATDRKFANKTTEAGEKPEEDNPEDENVSEAGSPEKKKAKLEEEKTTPDEDTGDAENDDATESEPKTLRGQVKGNLIKGSDLGNDDCVPVPDETMNPLIEYYGLDPKTFPRDLFMARACASEVKVIYYVAKPIKKLIDMGIQERVTVIHTGLKGFIRNNRNNAENQAEYRFCQEAVEFIIPHMTKRKFLANLQDFRTAISTPGETQHLSKFSKELAEQLKPLSTGAFVLILNLDLDNETELKDAGDDQHRILAAVMWKCRGDSVDSMVAKIEIDSILSKLDAIQGGVIPPVKE